MQLRYALTTLLFGLACAETVVGRYNVRRRQDSGDVTSAPPASTAPSVTSTDGPPTTSTPTSSPPTSTAKDSQKTTANPKSGTTHAITTTHPATSSAASHNGTTQSEEVKLPIEPTITPALGIAGVLLICTGVAFTIIGIKHQWLLVFLSAAYLTSLSVTVLIVYVMTPPVSDAIQGAYMVAAVVTGLIFGAICLVFKEMTEGFGCLIGGFCMAMWFLVLKPGGLITSTTGRAIMIGAFSAVAWSLAFSQYTRNYGLIGCTAFAGAMITMLGVDCFSRAGLKEFWLYIWNLNENIFPIHTTTYPITRGIRVEIAGTIVLFLFGVMSQIKVWKIVKERKSKKEAARQAELERRDMRDSKIGKRVEANNERSLAQWEAVYGHRDSRRTPADSGLGTSVDDDPKNSTSVAERELESIELDDVSDHAHKHSNKGPQTSVQALGTSKKEAPKGPALELDLDAGDFGWWADFRSNKSKSNAGTVRGASTDQASVTEISDAPPVPPVPALVSLQFTPHAGNEEGQNLVEGTPETERSLHEKRSVPLNQLALKWFNEHHPTALPRIDDDRASSVAATANEDPDMDNLSTKRLSVPLSSYQVDVNNSGLSPFADEFETKDRNHRSSRSPRTPGTVTPREADVFEHDDEELVRPTQGNGESGLGIEIQQNAKKHKRRSSTGSIPRDTASNKGDDESEDAVSVHSLKPERLPEGESKVAMAYRTNEWAKHITEADQPDLDVVPEAENDEAAVQIEINRPQQEVAKPVDTEALLETGAVDSKRPKTTKNDSYRQSKDRSNPRRRSTDATPVYAFNRSSSYQSLERQGSSTSVNQERREIRTSSAPFTQQPLVELPTEESPYEEFETPMGSTSNLLDDRNNRLKRRITTTSFNALTMIPNANTIVPSSIDGTTPSSPKPNATESKDDLTLAERKALLEEGAIRPATARPRSSVRRSSNQNFIYDSHQPKRSSTVDKNQQRAALTLWRKSLQQGNGPKLSAAEEEQARQAMLKYRQQRDYKNHKQKADLERRESVRDMAMRTGQLTGAHQDAMRRMQAKAKVSGTKE